MQSWYFNNMLFPLYNEKLIIRWFIPLVAKLRSTSLQVIVTRSEGVKTIVSVISSLRGGADDEPSSSLRLCTASTANSHWEQKSRRFSGTCDASEMKLNTNIKHTVLTLVTGHSGCGKCICVVNMRFLPENWVSWIFLQKHFHSLLLRRRWNPETDRRVNKSMNPGNCKYMCTVNDLY